MIEDSLSFIKKNYLKYNFHIVSGAEHNELNNLCKHFIIDKYFISILGSPITKNTLVKNIISDYEYNNDQVILIGDSKTDYVAAKKNKIIFYGYNNTELKKFGNYIEKFQYMNL